MDDLLIDIEEYNQLREELRLLIVPLIRKAMKDNPSDIALYCARYFQALCDDRDKAIELPESKQPNIPKDRRSNKSQQGSKDYGCKPQGSTSLPTLREEEHSSGLQPRGTCSWSNASDSSQKSTRRRKVEFNLADALGHIGDQSDIRDEYTEPMANVDENGNVALKSEGNKSLSRTDGGNNKRGRKSDFNDDDTSSMGFSNKSSSSYPNDDFTPSAPPMNKELDQEICTLVDLAERSCCLQPSVNNRKKWNSETDAQWELILKPKSQSQSSSSDSDNVADSYHKLIEEDDDSDELLEPMKGLDGYTSPNSSLGFIPNIRNLDKVVIPKHIEETLTPLSAEDIDELMKSVSRTLKRLLKGLCASSLYFNNKLESVKQFREVVKNLKLPENRQTPPRKKRSITTFSSLDDRSKTDEDTKTPQVVDNFEEKSNVPKSRNSADMSSSNGQVREFLECKDSNSVTESSFKISDCQYKKRKAEMKTAVNSQATATQDKRGNDNSGGVFHRKEKIVDLKEKVVKKPTKDNELHKRDRSTDNRGILNPSFVMDDEDVQNEGFRKRQNTHFQHQDTRLRPHFGNRHRPPARQARCSNDFPFNRMPYGSSERSFPQTRYHNRPPHYTSSRIRYPSAHRSGIPFIGEGGDVFCENSRQCTVGTETDPPEVTERFRNLNSERNLDTTASNSDKRSENLLAEVSKKCDKKHEKNSAGNDFNQHKIVTLPSHSTNGAGNESKAVENVEKSKRVSNPLENVSQKSPCNVKQEKNDFNLKNSVNNSSLNPRAKSFSPTVKASKGDVADCQLKSGKKQTFPAKNGRGCFEQLDNPIRSLDFENKFANVSSDWTLENPVNDTIVETRGIMNNIDNSIMQNGQSRSENGVIPSSYDSKENVSDLETSFSNLEVNDSVNCQFQKNEFSGRTNNYLPERRCSHEKKSFKNRSKSDTKMSEGDQGMYDKCEQECEQGNPEDMIKQEEPGLGFACGDFISLEDNNAAPPSAERQDDGLRLTSGNSQVSNTPQENVPDVEIRQVSDSVPLNVQQRVQREEEIELNFACLSESETSELDSSDLSEEDFYGENECFEHKS